MPASIRRSTVPRSSTLLTRPGPTPGTWLRRGRASRSSPSMMAARSCSAVAPADLRPTRSRWRRSTATTAGADGPTGRRWSPRRGIDAAVRLGDGSVLAAGGTVEPAVRKPNLVPAKLTSAAEVYDPATGRWTATESMAEARSGSTAVGLYDGSALLVGGNSKAADMLDQPSCPTASNQLVRYGPPWSCGCGDTVGPVGLSDEQPDGDDGPGGRGVGRLTLAPAVPTRQTRRMYSGPRRRGSHLSGVSDPIRPDRVHGQLRPAGPRRPEAVSS